MELLIANGSVAMILAFSGVTLVSVLLMVYMTKYIKTKAVFSEPYVIPIENVSVNSVISKLAASEIDNMGYVALKKIDNYSCRILVQYSTQFDSVALSRRRKKMNRIINSQYGIKTTMSIFGTLSLLRINLVICEESSDELQKYLNRNIEKMLSRNEIVFPAAIVLDKQKLLLPDCMANLTLNQLGRYVAAAQFLYDILCA